MSTSIAQEEAIRVFVKNTVRRRFFNSKRYPSSGINVGRWVNGHPTRVLPDEFLDIVVLYENSTISVWRGKGSYYALGENSSRISPKWARNKEETYTNLYIFLAELLDEFTER